jgi:hypothetical protein
MTVRTYALLTSVLFLLFAVLHVVRLIAQWDVVIGPWHAPMWASVVAALVGGLLSFAGFRLSEAQRFSLFR